MNKSGSCRVQSSAMTRMTCELMPRIAVLHTSKRFSGYCRRNITSIIRPKLNAGDGVPSAADSPRMKMRTVFDPFCLGIRNGWELPGFHWGKKRLVNHGFTVKPLLVLEVTRNRVECPYPATR